MNPAIRIKVLLDGSSPSPGTCARGFLLLLCIGGYEHGGRLDQRHHANHASQAAQSPAPQPITAPGAERDRNPGWTCRRPGNAGFMAAQARVSGAALGRFPLDRLLPFLPPN